MLGLRSGTAYTAVRRAADSVACFKHLYSPRMIAEIKEEKIQTGVVLKLAFYIIRLVLFCVFIETVHCLAGSAACK